MDQAGHFSSQPATAWVVLAAGQGTRMRSSLPKVLHPLCGRPLGAFCLAEARLVPDWQLVLVVGHEAERVQRELGFWAARFGVQVAFVRQQPQLGTGHAVQCALGALARSVQEVVISCADMPLLRGASLLQLVDARRRAQAAGALLAAVVDDPTGYGRILRRSPGDGGDGVADVAAIVEERDATPEQRRIREVNTGTYCFQREPLEQALAHLRPDNAQGEYYLTDTVGWLAAQGRRVVAVPLADPLEAAGVNDRAQLARLEQLLFRRARQRLEQAGARFAGEPPAQVEPWVEAGADCVLYPGAYVGGESRLGRGCVVGPGARVVDSVLEEDVWVAGATLVGCHVGRSARIGPGVAIAPGSVISAGALIGETAAWQGLGQGGSLHDGRRFAGAPA
ncbi:MAG TPA: NTP transferase domain-containing protein [Limnochordales bacterium]